ncbi:MAG: hypothetical protein B6D44_02600 [Ignavibacteriales bacterium UTCHB2]|nr:MAG: hypothetical protein BWY38_00395 [Ignavibacteria bacterium ADurb.Bin266]OQY74923.1 MAG: hypothetical protein B6D44_02600 [Ignavibacteriales bacterium UTCHB2]HQJ45131.1 lysylphosphatidylglycerol synthase transmembrane domain-containing protein [Ignavibacteriaceae bacterium]
MLRFKMKNMTKSILFILGFAFFIYLVLDLGIDNIINNILKTGWYFIPIVGIWLFIYFFNTVAWNYIINDKRVSFSDLFSITISSYALNYMTPFFHLGGEPYKVIALKKYLGTNRSISVTISYLMLHFLSSFLFWIAAIVAIYFLLPVSGAAYLILTVCLLVFFVVVYFFLKGYKNGVTKSFAYFIAKLPLLKKFNGAIFNKEEFFNDIDENIKELLNNRPGNFWAANIFELLSRLIGTLEFYFILTALGYSPTLLDSFLINAGASIISNLLFIVPFEVGVKEGGLYLTLQLLNFVPLVGVYIGLVNRIRELFWIMIGLLLMVITGKRNIKKEIKEVVIDESYII